MSAYRDMIYLPEDDERLGRFVDELANVEEETTEESGSGSESSNGFEFTATKSELIKRIRERNPEMLSDVDLEEREKSQLPGRGSTIARATKSKRPQPRKVARVTNRIYKK